MIIDAALRQQLPTGDGKDVAGFVVQLFGHPPWDSAACLIPDIEARVASGEKKYGTRLKTNNGRNALLDLYQEVLDGVNYAAQNILEAAGKPDAAVVVEPYLKVFQDLVDIAIRVKKLLLAQETVVQ